MKAGWLKTFCALPDGWLSELIKQSIAECDPLFFIHENLGYGTGWSERSGGLTNATIWQQQPPPNKVFHNSENNSTTQIHTRTNAAQLNLIY